MRVKPSAGLAVAIFLGYAVFLYAAFLISGVDYDEVSDTTGNVVRAIVIPIGVASLLLAALTTRLGWWREALFESRPAGPRWLLVVPAAMAIAIVVNLVSADYGEYDAGFVLVLLIGTLFVGFAEEIVTRGLMLTGFRGSVSEVKVWLFTSLLFGVLHGLNFLAGQALGDTLKQMAFAAGFGSVLYLIRRVSGTLIVCIVLHGLWDFSVFLSTGEDVGPATTDASTGIVTILNIVLIVVTIIGLVKLLRGSGDGGSDGGARREREPSPA